MEHSGLGDVSRGAPPPGRTPRAPASLELGLVALEILARISVPASVLLVSRGAGPVAAAVAAVALFATIARGFATSFAIERMLRATFDAVVAAALRLALVDLRAERRIGLLAEAAREAAVYEATMTPLLVAYVVAIVLTWGALIVVLGPLWALGLVAAAAPLVLALAFGARRIRAQQVAAWTAFADIAIDLRVLVEACVELRAHDREPSFANALTTRARSFARAERRANVWSAASSALPSAIVFVAATTPIQRLVGETVASATGARAAEIAIVAGAALYFALGLGRLLEQRARYAPFREALERFLGGQDGAAPPGGTPARDHETATDPASARAQDTPTGTPPDLLSSPSISPPTSPPAAPLSTTPPPGTPPSTAPRAPSIATATLRFRDVSCHHPHATRATPERVSFTWPAGRGLLLTGENGAGKSTLVLALLGLIRPSAGAIEIDGATLDEASAKALRARCAYLSQSPFVEPGASVAWHLRLLARAPIDDARIDAALRRVGLWRVLAEHAARRDPREIQHPRDILAGELSGGERQRMHIARVLVHEADLLILDEPEAGLDRDTRAEMATLFEDLARERRVLVIAHDPTIVPASFARLDIHPEPRAPR